jgi:Sulfotransferase family
MACHNKPFESEKSMSKQILIIGTPRSGTTWVFEVLAGAANVTPVLEPDNEKVSFTGRMFKPHLPRFPTLQLGDEDTTYTSLWQQAMHSPFGSWLATNRFLRTLEGMVFNGENLVVKKEKAALEKFLANGKVASSAEKQPVFRMPVQRQAKTYRIVKSVHAVFATEWIAHKTQPDHMLLVQRMPHGILASMKKLVMGDALRLGSLAPHLTSEELEQLRSAGTSAEQNLAGAALQLAKMYAHMEQLFKKHAHFISVKHETLCEDPVGRYRELFDKIELPWSAKIEAGIRERDRPGEGFAAVRKASDQIGKWKKSMDTGAIDTIDRIFAAHGLEHWTAQAHASCAN